MESKDRSSHREKPLVAPSEERSELVEVLIDKLSAGDEAVREHALARLSFAEGRTAVLGVVLALNDTSEGIRRTARKILQDICPEVEEVGGRVLPYLDSHDRQVRLRGIRELVNFLPSIRQALAKRSPGWREVECSIDLGPEDPMTVDLFDEEYPEELPDRLQWMECQLSVDRGRLLQLLGLTREEAEGSATRTWSEITSEVEAETAERVEHLLSHYLSYFNYSTEAAVRFSRQFPDRVRSGEIDLEEYIPDYRENSSLAKREEALIAAIFDEGPGLLPALAVFLFSASLPFKPTASPEALETSRY